MVGLLATLLLCEFFIFHSGTVRRSEVYFDASKGKSYKPFYSYVWFSEGFSMGEVNAGGYLGPYYSEKKDEKIKRIALLGDSYVEGFQVFERNHFRNHLERLLNENASHDSIEVLNFGRSNFNIPNMYAYQHLVVEEYQPDLVIYFVSLEDMWSLQTDVLLPNVHPMSLEVMPCLSDDSAPGFKKANTVLSRSSFAYMANSARRKIQGNGFVNVVLDQTPSGEVSDTIPDMAPISYKLLKKLDPLRTMLVYREKKAIPENYKRQLRELGLPLIDMSSYLSALEEEGSNPNAWMYGYDGHWNRQGHLAVAKFLADKLQPEFN